MPLKDKVKRREYLLNWQRNMRANMTDEKRQKVREYAKKYNETRYRSEEYRAKCVLKTKLYNYGITEEQYSFLWEAQEGLCMLCGLPFGDRGNRPVIDHCHISGGIRGILHNKCNVAIGMLEDNPDKLRLAVTYLERFQIEPEQDGV